MNKSNVSPNVNSEKYNVNNEIQALVENHYEDLLNEVFKTFDPEIHNLTIKVEMESGLTVTKSFKDKMERIE